MALSAHLAAVQSGLALIVFGLIWKHLALNSFSTKLTYVLGVLSMYLVWLSITLAAIIGASKALPIAGAGYQASQLGEIVVELSVTAGAGLGVVASALIVYGLYRSIYVESK